MTITGYVWLEDILEKLEQKHGVFREEVEELLLNTPYIRFVEKGHWEGENVYAAMGQTDDGRYLIVFFVYKTDKRALVVSARDMTDAERKQYEHR